MRHFALLLIHVGTVRACHCMENGSTTEAEVFLRFTTSVAMHNVLSLGGFWGGSTY